MNNLEQEIIELNVTLDEQVEELEVEVNRENYEELVDVEREFITTIINKDYEALNNKPQINEVELVGNKTSDQLNLQSKMDYLTNMEIENLIK